MLLEFPGFQLREKRIGLQLLFLEHIHIRQQMLLALLKHFDLLGEAALEITHHLYNLLIPLINLPRQYRLHRMILLLLPEPALVLKRALLALVELDIVVVVVAGIHVVIARRGCPTTISLRRVAVRVHIFFKDSKI